MCPYTFAPLMRAAPPPAPSPLPPRAALLALQLNHSPVDNFGNQMLLPPQKAGCYQPEAAAVVTPEYLAYLHASLPPTAFAPSLPSQPMSQFDYKYLATAAPEVAERILASCRKCVKTRRPVYAETVALSEEKSHLKVGVLYVPLSENGARIDRLFLHVKVSLRSAGIIA
jgi:hypothetical protein